MGGGVGENQIFCIAQVQVLEFLFNSLISHDSDLPDLRLILTRPGPGPELDNWSLLIML